MIIRYPDEKLLVSLVIHTELDFVLRRQPLARQGMVAFWDKSQVFFCDANRCTVNLVV
jgi:hypothetical protein